MSGIADSLRIGRWITRERTRLVALAIITAFLLGLGVLVATSHGSIDIQGRPLGTDFSNVYTAGRYVLHGQAAAPFDPQLQEAGERAIFGPQTPFYGWHYPPYFLFIAAALAMLPYGLALAVWQGVTFLLYLLAMWGIVAGVGKKIAARNEQAPLTEDPLWLLLAVAFPAVFINLGHGHNGFLTAALMGGALVALEREAVIAGILFGLLAYKPQFGLMVPLVLAASGRWRAFGAAAVTVVLLTLATTLAFGLDIWNAFLASTHFTRVVVLEAGDTGWHKIQSVFSWVRMWGGSVDLAYAVQGIVTVVTAIALAWLWRSNVRFALKAAALPIAAIMATPYSLDYDMMVLAPAIALFAIDGLEHGFLPWEKSALAALWLAPLVTRTVAEWTLIPLGVPAMLVVFLLVMRRAATYARFAVSASDGSNADRDNTRKIVQLPIG